MSKKKLKDPILPQTQYAWIPSTSVLDEAANISNEINKKQLEKLSSIMTKFNESIIVSFDASVKSCSAAFKAISKAIGESYNIGDHVVDTSTLTLDELREELGLSPQNRCPHLHVTFKGSSILDGVKIPPKSDSVIAMAEAWEVHKREKDGPVFDRGYLCQ